MRPLVVAITIVGACGGEPRKAPPVAPTTFAPTKSSDGAPVTSETGRVTVGDKAAFDESTLTPDTVLGEIQSTYLDGIKRCYKNHLKQHADARGKVKLDFTVTETGTITNGKATGFATPVDDCVTQLMTAWKFPIPMDRDGAATTAAFAITLQLIPD